MHISALMNIWTPITCALTKENIVTRKVLSVKDADKLSLGFNSVDDISKIISVLDNKLIKNI